jgi:hypothetical protein
MMLTRPAELLVFLAVSRSKLSKELVAPEFSKTMLLFVLAARPSKTAFQFLSKQLVVI